MKRKYYILYKTTNLKNNKFYIGVHETNNLNDGYLGSGKKFKNSLYYHGKENFKLEILEYFDNSKKMYQRELEVVNEELLKNPKCLNLKLGGTGGFSHISKKQRLLNSSKGGNSFKRCLETDLEFRKKHNKIASDKFKEYNSRGTHNYKTFLGKKHSEETKKKIGKANSIKQKGINNSQYGTCWITNEKINKKIYRGDEIPKGFRLGRNKVVNLEPRKPFKTDSQLQRSLN